MGEQTFNRHDAEALGYHLERIYGEKVPLCPRCHSASVRQDYARDCWDCGECGWTINPRCLLWVPKDESVRTLNEIAYYDRGHPAAGVVARQALAQIDKCKSDGMSCVCGWPHDRCAKEKPYTPNKEAG